MRAFGLYDTEVEREERTIMAQEGQEDGGAAAAVAVAPEALRESAVDMERADSGGHVSSVPTLPMTQTGDKRVEWLRDTACSMLGVTEAHFEEMVTRDESASKTIETWLAGGTF